jgi:hypothetical protein
MYARIVELSGKLAAHLSMWICVVNRVFAIPYARGHGPQERGMQRKSILVTVAAFVALTGAAASAHHSSAAYDTATIVLKDATVKNLVWANPHTVLTFEVKDAKGVAATWNAESGSPSALTRMGWNRNAVKTGDRVTIQLFPARNGARVGRLSKVTLADGRELRDSQGTEGSVGKPVS